MANAQWPIVDADAIAWIDTETMVEVDRAMIEDLGIGLVQMMENAGRNLSALSAELYQPSSAVVYVGSGGNGGGGLVAARHLSNRGVEVAVVAGRPPERLTEVTRLQYEIVQRMGLPISDTPVEADIVVDALIGYSLSGAPRGRVADLIEAISNEDRPVVSLDVPSGVDATTGQTPGLAVRSDATLALALPKLGLRGHANVGRLFVGDISVPRMVYEGVGLSAAPVFGQGPILEITEAEHR